MTTREDDIRAAIQQARWALSNGDRRLARQWAERAAKLAPHLEDPWLILAAVAGPRQGLEFIQKALQINPESPRARSGMEWLMKRLGDPNLTLADTGRHAAAKLGSTQETPRVLNAQAVRARGTGRRILLPAALLLAGCMVLGLAGWAAMSSPLVANMLVKPAQASGPTQPPQWAQASIPKPTYTPAVGGGEIYPAPTPTTDSSQESTALSTDLPTAEPTQAAPTAEPPTAEPTWSGSLSMDYVPDTPTPEAPPYVPPTAVRPPVDTASGEHWIDVDLSNQMVYAYAGDTIVNSFLVSTGTYLTPTVTGKFKVWIKLRSSDMSGADYYLPDVPYIMYFYKDYGLHGTYWHNNFGTPMSHGCVNLSIPDAEWLYNFSYVGTVVNVHY